ncbi:MAG: signal peptide peptidase SppA [Spirochaetia bacterium]
MAYTRILLSGSYHDGPANEGLSIGSRSRPRFRYDRFFEQVRRLLRSRRIRTVVIDHRADFSPGGFAAVESIRAELVRLAAAGKKLVFCCEECDVLTLYLASACPTRVIHPSGELRVLGIARRFLFFRRLLDRFGTRMTILRRGQYKSAADGFRRDSLDPANREQYEAFYGGAHHRLLQVIAEGLGKTDEDLGVLLEGHVLPAEQAVSHGWMTRAATVHEVVRDLEKEHKEKYRATKVHGRVGRRGRRVAVLFLDGAICDGESRRDPVLGRCVGDRSLVREIRGLADDKRTKAVVLRVSSPGGSALASESIRRELLHLHEKKPIVVSMGNVAGSGGYWVATEADRVFAEPSTLTGSIGVIMILPELETTLKRQGITSDVVRTGRFADLGSPFRRMSRDEHELLDRRVEQVYEDFLERAAVARKLSREAIENVAGGRVWSGVDAVSVGLVDELGGLPEALEWLRSHLQSRRLALRFHPQVKPSIIERVLAKRLSAAAGIHGPSAAAAGGPAVAKAVLALQGRPLAIVPEHLTGTGLLER